MLMQLGSGDSTEAQKSKKNLINQRNELPSANEIKHIAFRALRKLWDISGQKLNIQFIFMLSSCCLFVYGVDQEHAEKFQLFIIAHKQQGYKRKN